jgi:hypothetical protein
VIRVASVAFSVTMSGCGMETFVVQPRLVREAGDASIWLLAAADHRR